MQNKLLITIDGPAASGKGTVAKILGARLSLPVLYTGNIYRAIAYKIWVTKQDPHNLVDIIKAAKDLKLSDLENNVLLNHEQVGQYASIIGAYPELRQETFKFQRDFIDRAEKGAIIEGRDIGTVICPEANFKFYITADVEIRARRRFIQQKEDSYDTILTDLKERDERDMNRAIAPLKPAENAIIIDNTHLTIEQTLETILSFVIPK